MSAPAAISAPFLVDRSSSPWQGYTSTAEEEARGKQLAAVAIEPSFERPKHLERFAQGGEPLLAIDRKQRRVVVNQKFFSKIARADVTRLGRNDHATLGQVIDPALRARGKDVVLFLLTSELIQTYIHMGSRLTLAELQDDAAGYRARITGSHVFFTNSRHEEKLDFEVLLDRKTGEVIVTGR